MREAAGGRSSAATRSTIREPKYGLAVTGMVHPDEVLTNAGGRAGDVLVLTKPLGAGAIVDRGQARDAAAEALVGRAVAVMTTLNATPRPRRARGRAPTR